MKPANSFILTASILCLGVMGHPTASADPSTSTSTPVAIGLGEPITDGNGCPEGTVGAALGFEGTSLSILFDAYFAETTDGDRRVERWCDVSLPVSVPPGMRASVTQIDLRGFAMVPDGGKVQLRSKYFLDDHPGPRTVDNFSPGMFDVFVFEHHLPPAQRTWSDCGEDFMVRVETSMEARKTPGTPDGDETFVSIDSADVAAGIELALQWERCAGPN